MLLEALWRPLLPLWLPLLAAPVVYLVRRRGMIVAPLAALVMALCGWWLVAHPPGSDLVLFGRPLLVSNLGQAVLVALAAWLAFAFLFSWRISPGWSAFPFLLVVYSLIAAALFFEELILQVLLLKLAWLVVILLVQGGAQSNTRAATRLLILAVLALPPFLLAGTMINQLMYQPDVVAPSGVVVLLLGMGFILMLAVIPFHAWLPQAAEDGPPLIAAWLAAGMGTGYLAIMFDLLAEYEWLAQDSQMQSLLFGGGLLLAIAGGLLAVTERHLGRLWAYVVLADLGYIFLALSFATRTGRATALLVLGSRLLSLLLAGSALATIRHRATSLEFDRLVGIGARLPLSLMAFALGGGAMLGAPLTAGFPGHWSVLRLLAEQQSPWLWALIAASILGLVGFVRAFAVMVSLPDEEGALEGVEREPRVATGLLIALTSISLLLGLAPQVADPVLTYLLGSFRF